MRTRLLACFSATALVASPAHAQSFTPEQRLDLFCALYSAYAASTADEQGETEVAEGLMLTFTYLAGRFEGATGYTINEAASDAIYEEIGTDEAAAAERCLPLIESAGRMFGGG